MLRDHTVLNPRLLAALAALGHTDLVVVADAGLPLPPGVEVIDVSLVPGVPTFAQVLDVVLASTAIESAAVAAESAEHPAGAVLAARLTGLTVERIDHAELKRRSHQARLVVRTGECSPYANVVLAAGVTF